MTPRLRGALLLVLSFAAGCVDAVAFLRLGVFPANMTGNTVVLALALAGASVAGAALSAGVLVAFAAGGFSGAWYLARSRGQGLWPRPVSQVLFLSGLLLAAAPTIAALVGPHYQGWMAILAALAMGLQGAAVQSLGVPGVATTVVTGALTAGLSRAARRFVTRDQSIDAGALPLGTWLAYFLGALVGGAQFVFGLTFILAAPAALLLGTALFAQHKNRPASP